MLVAKYGVGLGEEAKASLELLLVLRKNGTEIKSDNTTEHNTLIYFQFLPAFSSFVASRLWLPNDSVPSDVPSKPWNASLRSEFLPSCAWRLPSQLSPVSPP